MPRVSQDYLNARRQHILLAAARRFASQGFHQTSMQDILAESGLSAGAFYRYFASKEELIEAIVGNAADAVQEAVDAALAAEPEPTIEHAVEQIILGIDRLAASFGGTTGLAMQAWLEALREPRIAERVTHVYGSVHGYFTEVARRARRAGRLRADADPVLVGRAMLSLVLGFVVQRNLYGKIEPPDYARGIRDLLVAPPGGDAAYPGDAPVLHRPDE